ncbi:MAG TPA: bifunctional riboflavin kinase/FAD synthetase [Bacteroidota bacterium]|nr:bifunctional riboflavin kinase/FAD synthetase [Bacteroidota bacterium]
MIVAQGFDTKVPPGGSTVTVGTFDGLHLGHRKILDTVVRRARASGTRSMVVTFHPHPRTVLGKGDVPLLTTLEERLELIGTCGIDCTVILAFTYGFSRLTADEFFRTAIVDGAGAREIVIGYDHMFGRDRAAGPEQITAIAESVGIAVTTVDPVSRGSAVISSSAIRKLLLAGSVDTAAEYLGRPYALSGIVVPGDARGRLLGYPTANLAAGALNKVVPGNGVYLVEAGLGGERRFGVMNIGTRPTFGTAGERTMEVHLLEFSGTLYGREIAVGFLRRLRDERKFPTQQELMTQISADLAEARAILSAGTYSHS